jgi:hypothetical protein
MELDDAMFEVMFADDGVEEIRGANGYVQEGPLTTFFRSERCRVAIDSWSERVASFRTTDIRRIMRRGAPTLRAVRVDSDYDVEAAGVSAGFGLAAG